MKLITCLVIGMSGSVLGMDFGPHSDSDSDVVGPNPNGDSGPNGPDTYTKLKKPQVAPVAARFQRLFAAPPLSRSMGKTSRCLDDSDSDSSDVDEKPDFDDEEAEKVQRLCMDHKLRLLAGITDTNHEFEGPLRMEIRHVRNNVGVGEDEPKGN